MPRKNHPNAPCKGKTDNQSKKKYNKWNFFGIWFSNVDTLSLAKLIKLKNELNNIRFVVLAVFIQLNLYDLNSTIKLKVTATSLEL